MDQVSIECALTVYASVSNRTISFCKYNCYGRACLERLKLIVHQLFDSISVSDKVSTVDAGAQFDSFVHRTNKYLNGTDT